MGELSLIRHFRAFAPTHPWLIVGPGQDCAVLRWPDDRDQAFKIDQVVEGTHFLLSGPGAATPYQVGWKAMAKTCSDIAACGFWPVATMVAVNLRRGSDERIARDLYEGLCACCKRFSFGLAGGDVSVSEQGLGVVVSIVAEGPRGGAWLRRGAQVGDALLVTGSLGGSLRSAKHLDFSPRLEEAREIRRIAGGGVHACIDITDGLSRDLHHLCEESDCGAAVFQESVPCGAANFADALSDGEDFELLLAVAPDAAEILLKQWRMSVPLTRIGEIRPKPQGCVVVAAGSARPMPDVGYEHGGHGEHHGATS